MISSEDVRKLAALARIKLEPGEEESLAKDMENILGYVKQIQEVKLETNLGDISAEKERVRNVLRSDDNVYEPEMFTEAILAEAPKRKGQYVKVKKIL